MHILGSYRRPAESETPETGPPHLCSPKSPSASETRWCLETTGQGGALHTSRVPVVPTRPCTPSDGHSPWQGVGAQ